jgi:hypothetical protein
MLVHVSIIVCNAKMDSPPVLQKLKLWKILLLFILLGSDPTYFPANFHCSISVHSCVSSAHLFSPIRVYFDFSYIYHCTAHNSSVLFWTQNRLDQIKVITRAHPGHYFHKIFLSFPSQPSATIPYFCWAKLNHRTLMSTPPKFGNDCRPRARDALTQLTRRTRCTWCTWCTQRTRPLQFYVTI